MTNHQVVPEAWIADSFAGGPDSREAFASTPDDTRMPGGMYRNQFWFPWPDRQVLLCLGIHGQMIYVNRAPVWWRSSCRAGRPRRIPGSCSQHWPPLRRSTPRWPNNPGTVHIDHDLLSGMVEIGVSPRK